MSHPSLTVGAFEVTPLCDGWAPLPLEDELPGRHIDWGVKRERFPWAFAPHDDGHWAWHVHAFLLRGLGSTALIDAGIGAFGRPPFDVAGRIDAELATLGVGAEKIEHVVLTHLHADHSGGTCRADGGPRFENARHHVHPEDWSFFREQRTADDFTARFAMSAVEDAGLLDLDPDDRLIAPGIELVHAPGHTPGHRVVRVGTRDERLLLTGDLLHVPPQVQHPEWPSTHDEDPELGARERAGHLGEARKEGCVVGVSHFGRPFGRIVDDGWAPV